MLEHFRLERGIQWQARETPRQDITRTTATPVLLERCGNRGRTIGKLEQAHVWQEHIVCSTCRGRLAQSEANPPHVRLPPQQVTAALRTPMPAPEREGESNCSNRSLQEMVGILAGLFVIAYAIKEILGGEAMTAHHRAVVRRDEEPGKFWAIVISRIAFGVLLLMWLFIHHSGN